MKHLRLLMFVLLLTAFASATVTVNVTSPAPEAQVIPTVSISAVGTTTAHTTGAVVTGFNVYVDDVLAVQDPGNSQQRFDTTVTLTPGRRKIEVKAWDSAGAYGSETFYLNVTAPPDITTTTLADGTVGTAYSKTLTTTGGLAPLSFSILSGTLPAGLSLTSDGIITGTPTTVETKTFTVRVADAFNRTDDQSLTLKVNAAAVPPTITTTTLPNGTVGTAYSQTLATSGGTTPLTYSIVTGSLPAGLTLSSAGTISGTPTTAQTASLTVRVTDANLLTDDQALTLTISAAMQSGIFMSTSEIMALPMTGTAWTNLNNAANGSWGTANVGDQNSNHDRSVLAGALVAVRTGSQTMRDKTIAGLNAVIGTETNSDPECRNTGGGASLLSVGRNLTAYIVAADLLNYRETAFLNWVQMMHTRNHCANQGGPTHNRTMAEAHGESGSNASAQVGAARIATALYLSNTADVDSAFETYKRYAGDPTACPTCVMSLNTAGATWACNTTTPVGVNPTTCTKTDSGGVVRNIGGAVPNDQGRGGSWGAWPPPYTQYPWVGLEGFVLQTWFLERSGRAAKAQSQDALKRVVQFQYDLYTSTGDSRWWDRTHFVKYLVNRLYGVQYPAGAANSGFMFAWTDWTHPTQ